MEESISEVAVGVLVALLGLIGLFMASGALDDEIYLFGLGLAAFAVVFLFGRIKTHFDQVSEGEPDV
jgi:uncharacterized membrane protein YbhN (UPF0104 family)